MKKNSDLKFSEDTDTDNQLVLNDPLANSPIDITRTYNLNQEFITKYKTHNPDGIGEAVFKARSVKEVTEIDGRSPSEGKKLVIVEISVKGKATNKGSPSSFNQIGDTPSPQFVIIDKAKNISLAENTYFSDAYTQSKKLFELSKITLDHERLVDTAIVFEIDKSQTTDLAFRFSNPEGQTEFYDIKE